MKSYKKCLSLDNCPDALPNGGWTAGDHGYTKNNAYHTKNG